MISSLTEVTAYGMQLVSCVSTRNQRPNGSVCWTASCCSALSVLVRRTAVGAGEPQLRAVKRHKPSRTQRVNDLELQKQVQNRFQQF